MRLVLITFAFLFNTLIFSQDIDSLKLKRLKNNVEILNSNIEQFILDVDKTNNLETINLLSLKLKEECSQVIDTIYRLYRLGEDDSYLSSVYYSMAVTYSATNPSLSATYTAMGTTALFDDNSLTPPTYYRNLKDIRYYANRMKRAKKLQKVKKLNGKLSKVFYDKK